MIQFFSKIKRWKVGHKSHTNQGEVLTKETDTFICLVNFILYVSIEW